MNIVEQIFGPNRLQKIGHLPALKWEGGFCTYSQLAHRIQQAGSEFNSLGIGPGDRAVFQCTDTPAFVACYFGALNIGAVAVIVSTRLSPEDLDFVIRDCEASAVICDSQTRPSGQTVEGDGGSNLLRLNVDQLTGDEPATEELETRPRSPADEALWVYSSGSTSRPKGIVHTHRSIIDCCAFHSDTLGVAAGDLVFCTSKLSFAYALANGLFAPLQLGAAVYLHPDWITPDALRSVLTIEKPRVVFSVPSIYRNLLNQAPGDQEKLFSIPDHYVSAGEHLPSEIRLRWQELSNRTIINVYGCSETLFLALAGNPDDTPLNSVGTVLPNVNGQLKDFSQESPSNDSIDQGVLHLTHPFMFTHYANRAKDTAQRLANGQFNTGDLYRQDANGNFFHLGREDDLIKVSGQWVYLREIETVGRELPHLIDICVVAASDHTGMIRPAMFFVSSDKISANDAVLRMKNHIETHLPRIKRPSWVRVLEKIPRTATGKTNRLALQKIVEGTNRD